MTEESRAVMTQQRPARADLETIYRAAIAAVEPARLVGRAMDGGCPGAEQVPDLVAGARRVLMLAVGKASRAMAHEIERRIGDKLADAVVVVPRNSAATTKPALTVGRVVASSHPVPDESSEAAANLACEMLHRATADDLVIVAISGGASAMFTRPAEGLTLGDKIAVNEALLKAGASIRELNTVRKHLATVKIADPILERVTNVIIGDNNLALEAAERAAAGLGYHVQRSKGLHGEAN